MNGYIYIDLGGLDLTADTSEAAITVSGLFAAASDAIKSGKPIFAVNSVNGNAGANTPIQCYGNLDTAITLIVSVYSLAITSADAVTITPLIPEPTESTKAKTSKK